MNTVNINYIPSKEANVLSQTIRKELSSFGKLLDDKDAERVDIYGLARFYIYDIYTYEALNALFNYVQNRNGFIKVSISSYNYDNTIASYQAWINWEV